MQDVEPGSLEELLISGPSLLQGVDSAARIVEVQTEWNIEFAVLSRTPETMEKVKQKGANFIRDTIKRRGKLIPWKFIFAYYPDFGQVCQRIDKGLDVIKIDYDTTVTYSNSRILAAAITIDKDKFILHPPATPQLARARVSELLGTPYWPTPMVDPLMLDVIAKHYPNTMLDAGRPLSADERRMSIAYLVDLERIPNEPVKIALARVRSRLVEFGLIDDVSETTLEQYLNEGLILLRRAGMRLWETPPRGRPRKKV